MMALLKKPSLNLATIRGRKASPEQRRPRLSGLEHYTGANEAPYNSAEQTINPTATQLTQGIN